MHITRAQPVNTQFVCACRLVSTCFRLLCLDMRSTVDTLLRCGCHLFFFWRRLLNCLHLHNTSTAMYSCETHALSSPAPRGCYPQRRWGIFAEIGRSQLQFEKLSNLLEGLNPSIRNIFDVRQNGLATQFPTQHHLPRPHSA